MDAAYVNSLLFSVPLVFSGVLLLLIASLHDLTFRLLPNWTSLGLTLIGVALRLLDGSLPYGIAAAVAVFLMTYCCWRLAWIGGGDVKLIAACALLVPPTQVLTLLFLTAGFGGVLAILYLALGRLLALRQAKAISSDSHSKSDLFRRLWRIECRRMMRRHPLPYGCAIASAALLLLLGPTGPLGK